MNVGRAVREGRAQRVRRSAARPSRKSIRDCYAHSLRELAEVLLYPGGSSDTRRALIFAAGVANNRKLLRDLGSQESSTWYEGRRAADPNFDNPYWPEGR